MRLSLVAVIAAAFASAGATCGADANDAELGGSGDGSGSGVGGGIAECTVATDCKPAAARCCDCPTFATPTDANGGDICAGVTCPMPGPQCAMDTHAACTDGQCVLACDVVECDATCADGFAVDANGCLTCACDQVATRECTMDTDCAETPADCCGCALGGTDTAVPAADVAAFEAGLDCPPDPTCPGVSTCQTDLSPRCVQGACALQPALPADACGRPDLPACPAGTVCVVNADPYASAQGVGTCQMP